MAIKLRKYKVRSSSIRKIVKLATIILPAVILLISSHINAQPGPFIVNGRLYNMQDSVQWIYCYYMDIDKKADTIKVNNGAYSWSGSLDGPSRINMQAVYKNKTANDRRNGPTIFFMEPGNIRIGHKDSFSNIEVTGSQAQNDYVQLSAELKEGGPEAQVYLDFFTRHPSSPIKLYVLRQYGGGYAVQGHKIDTLFHRLPASLRHSQQGEALYKDIETSKIIEITHPDSLLLYVKANPQSPVALMALIQYSGYTPDPARVAPLFELLPQEVKESKEGQQFNALLAVARKTEIGQVAPLFVQKDTAGIQQSLKAFRGNYLLLDFWASWCAPCRAENPSLVEAYQKFHNADGFNILSVSLERPNDEKNWLQAIHHDHLTWSHVSDLKYWDNDVAVLYGIKAVPQNFLIGPDGVIVARNLYGRELMERLEQIYKK